MRNTKVVRKKIKETYGADHPLMETFDRIVGLLTSGKKRVGMSMLNGERYDAKHFFDLSGNFLNFLEMRFILPCDGSEVDIPIRDVKRWIQDRTRKVLHPKTGNAIENMEEVCIWFYPVEEEDE